MHISEARELFSTHFRAMADAFALSPSAANWIRLEDSAYALQFIRFGPINEVEAWCFEDRPVLGATVLAGEIAAKQKRKLARLSFINLGGTGA